MFFILPIRFGAKVGKIFLFPEQFALNHPILIR
jgi:hypothetical protein